MPKLFTYLYLIPLAACVIASLRAFRLDWPGPLRLFSSLLIFILFTELFANAWSLWLYETGKWNNSSLWVYNSSLPCQYGAYFIFFYKIIKAVTFRRIILALSLLTFFVWFLENIIHQKFYDEINPYMVISYYFSIVLFSVRYFFQVLNSDKVDSLKKSPLFWICSGTFIYHLGTMPFYIFMSQIARINLSVIIALGYIMKVLTIVMYSLYTIAFLCRKQYQK